ncbi:Retrovirus-related Pol polyprotein from type-1 retrotransposable element R1 [Araneus ventricosus]|uniref:Retrovirus-related Pol polyprotein from type-1 retrotransposable element R1 n=1 Tax=Araneus ventricosus TaxID=182803 RepID=A0A4Y2QXD6_ARAVE|nr:Retrovirus-related Pol polyprotein from type-1 retrotransposable element R1 [Araneus ventricosus]
MQVHSTRNVVAITVQIQNKNVLVVSAYCPPSEELEDTLQELDACLLYPHDGVIIASDLNAKNSLWGGNTSDDRGNQLLEFTLSRGLSVLNEENSPPTFEGSTGRSWIDTTIGDVFTLDSISKWKVDTEPTGSDHNSISFSLYTGNTKKRKQNRFRLANLDPVRLRNALSKDLATLKFQENLHIDGQVEKFLDLLHKACHESKPRRQDFLKKNDWWSKHLEILRSNVRTAKRRLFRAKDIRDIRFLRSKVKEAEAIYRLRLNAAKREDWEDKCEKVTAEDPFGLHFDVAKTPDARFFQLNALRKENGQLTANVTEAIHHLLDYHFPQDVGPDSPFHARIRTDSKSPPNTSPDPPFSIPEVDAAIRNINSKKAPGPDGFYGDVIKEAYASNKHFIVDLFNQCLRTGYFPKKWKRAQLVMFNKPNRPICLLDALGKALDKLTTQRVLFHLLSNRHLHPNQFGFLPGRSAPDAILEVKDWISEARHESKHSIVISLDVRSAFSRVWWPLVLHTLKKFGCPRNLYNLISSFLEDWLSVPGLRREDHLPFILNRLPSGLQLWPTLLASHCRRGT